MEGRSQPESTEDLFVGWLARSGGEGDLEALCREHPEHAQALRKLHGDWLVFRSLLERAGFSKLVPDRSFAERLKERFGSGVDPGVSLEGRDDEPAGRPRSEPASSDLLRRLARHSKESRYSLKGEIGRGGMGAILKVWDEDLRRNLAMKVILGKADPGSTGATPPIDKRLLARFLEEAQVTGQLDHPGIVPVHELGLDSEGRVYFTMKLVKGRDLKTIFDLVPEEQEGWNETRALGVILKVCEAMAYAHAKGVIHRDLKPANVMVGNFGEVFVMDWGLARVLGRTDAHDLRLAPEARASTSLRTERAEERQEAPDSPLFTMDGDIVGTPAYMPPEQARGEIEKLSPRADVYAIGAMLYHLLARQMPYVPPGTRTTNRIVLTMVLQGSPARLHTISKDIPAELAAICEKAMAREHEQRYQDTLELADDLRAFLERRVVKAYRTGALAELGKWVDRNRGLAAATAAAILALLAGVVTSLSYAKRADEHARMESVARNDAEASARLAAEKEIAARRASEETTVRMREARENLYIATILLAQSAELSNEPGNARRLLDSAPEELRNWEWGYLDAQLDMSLFTVDGRTAEFSPDATRIVTACSDGTTIVWASESGQELMRLEGHSNSVNTASFGQDGTRIVTASEDGTARVWHAESGNELAKMEVSTSGVKLASFSHDGTHVVTLSRDNTVQVWDVTSGAELARFEGFSASLSPDGLRIVVLSKDYIPRVCNVSNPEKVAPLVGHTGAVFSALFCSDGTRIVTASADLTARVWDAVSGKELARLDNDDKVEAASFSPDGSRIVTVCWDHSARVWDSASGQGLARLEHVNSASFSPSASRVVTAHPDSIVRTWDAASGEELARFALPAGELRQASFNSDGTKIVATSSDDRVRVLDAVPATEFDSLPCFSPDGTRLLTESRSPDIAPGRQGRRTRDRA